MEGNEVGEVTAMLEKQERAEGSRMVLRYVTDVLAPISGTHEDHYSHLNVNLDPSPGLAVILPTHQSRHQRLPTQSSPGLRVGDQALSRPGVGFVLYSDCLRPPTSPNRADHLHVATAHPSILSSAHRVLSHLP